MKNSCQVSGALENIEIVGKFSASEKQNNKKNNVFIIGQYFIDLLQSYENWEPPSIARLILGSDHRVPYSDNTRYCLPMVKM
jgi:hypothetical protein